MATKREGNPCYQKAAEDEPLFVLRAQDILAPEVVRFWADRAQDEGVSLEKVQEARHLAKRMIEWQDANDRVKLPD